MDLAWARNLQSLAKAADIPFYFKQVTAERQHTGMAALGKIIRNYPSAPAGKVWVR